jgi:hypothetical protein
MKIIPVEPPCKLGWLDVRLPNEAIDRLNDYVSKASKTQSPSLTVPYSKDNPMAWEKSMKDDDDWFFDNYLLECVTEYQKAFPSYETPNLTKATPYSLAAMWVNYQRKHEFFRLHNHAGVYSFVIFMKIPIDWKEQHSMHRHHGNLPPCASDFQFVYSDMLGRTQEKNYNLDSSDEGRMLFWPSQLKHQVYTFYNSEEERVTISGNVLYDTKDIQAGARRRGGGHSFGSLDL